MSDFVNIPASEVHSEFYRILSSSGFEKNDALTCAEVFTNNSIDGIYSHGVNRFPKFISMVRQGHVKQSMKATRIGKAGNVEQWDGQQGVGPLNALAATDRAMLLAAESGIGCVALARTNHWMRGGTYGWKAAKAGFVFIGWSNTIANTPAWGAVNHKLGNNPLVIAVPFGNEAIVLDMAMSQFSYGAMEMYELKNQQLPVVGGYDTKGKLSTDPAEIKTSQRTLPIGFWKGSGLSLLLDILAAALSGGLAVNQITSQDAEKNLSQIFIAIDVSKFGSENSITKIIDKIIADFKTSVPETPGKEVRYPGENVLSTRASNLKDGIPVSRKVWDEIKAL
jgi:3-dehydro-L-gulonate 2-dehydrogenase